MWEWLLPKIKWVAILVIVITLAFMVYQYNECQRRGKKEGGAFKCPLFCKKPEPILAIDEYYDESAGECFHYVDFGDSMRITKVGMENCK